ncbi:MAG: 2,4-dienoyl-CoA reductase-like NADH-dependent reductase (Old Yellow Enzyme family) [Halieaceae bacterium]|jgi:2,4-dienoyl-CoA reductase-like NADH-dependent reductase (Old Yellow Enzyme family)
MWKPAERIKYTAVEDEWPSASEALASKLFSPFEVGPMTLSQRTWVPAMVPWRSNEEGEVTDDVLQWYRRFAEGKPGVIVVEATGVRNIASGPLLRIGDDRYIPGLKRLADVVREASGGETRLLIQIIDFLNIRRRPDPEKFLQRFLPITAQHREALGLSDADEQQVRDALQAMSAEEQENVLTIKEWEDMQLGYRERVTDVQIPAIAELPQTLPVLFASAASRAEQAGFDGVELHYAHAYTMASFLSATNTREDGYGGARENRVRLPLEVYQAVRDATGPDFAVGCRFLSDEIISQGNNVDDACFFGRAFAEAGMDFLSLSRGGKFDDAKQPKVGWAAYPYTGQSGYECMPGYISDEQGPFGRNIEPAAAIRESLRSHDLATPIVMAGGIYGFARAEEVLQADKADIIGLARQALADPDWFEKVKTGYGPEVIICRYSNYCEGLDQKHKQVTCELWDRVDLDEPGIAKTIDGKRRMIAPRWKPA